MRMNTKCILFDFFGTLVDYDASGLSQDYHKTYELWLSLGATFDYSEFLQLTADSFTRQIELAEESQREFSMLQVKKLMASELHLIVSDTQLTDIGSTYNTEWSGSVEPIQGLKPFLMSLNRGFRLGIITNTHYEPMVERLLNRFGIYELFEIITTSVEHGFAKPHVSIFETTLSKLNLAAKECIYVGDSYLADYVGASNAGLRCYLIGKHARVPVDCQIATVKDLPVHLIR